MAAIKGQADCVIEDIAGCGCYQIAMVILVILLGVCPATFSSTFMSFGRLNPGWRCNDSNEKNLSIVSQNINISSMIATYSTQDKSQSYLKSEYRSSKSTVNYVNNSITSTGVNEEWYFSTDTENECLVFQKCNDVIFYPESSTIISEWFLICDRAWMASFIVSVQMAGILIGSLFSGYFGGRFGRKRTFYGGILFLNLVNVISFFSISWEMFTVLRVLAGVFSGITSSTILVYATEFIPKKWRVVISSMPHGCWNSLIFSLIAFAFKDWRNIIMATIVIGVVAILPAIWFPESLRWLEIKNQRKRFEQGALRVIRMNGKHPPHSDNNLENILKLDNNESISGVRDETNYDIRVLFSDKFRKITFLISMPWFIVVATYYAILFGMGTLHGNFYINLIIFNTIEIPFVFIPMTIPNIIGRRLSSFLFGVISGLCFICAASLEKFGTDNVKQYGVLVFLFTGILANGMWWKVIGLITLEVYPTNVRALGSSWGNSMARIGAIVSPFVIPNDASMTFISYYVIGVISLGVACFVFKLPETKNARLKDVCDAETNEEVIELEHS